MALIKQYLSLCLLLLVGGTAANSTPTSVGSTVADTTSVTVGSTVADTTSVTVGSTVADTTSVTVGSTVADTTSVTVGSTVADTTSVTVETTTAPGPCVSSFCPLYSICQELLINYTCICGPGLFYDPMRESCNLAKAFPFEFTLKKECKDEMPNNESYIFKQTADELLKDLKDVFKTNTDHLGSTVLSLKCRDGHVIADVENFFIPSSNMTEYAVLEALKQAVSNTNGTLSDAEFVVKSICTQGFCDALSTNCEHNNGLAICTCKKGYIKITATRQACAPCPSGKKEVNSDKCDECPFGYSGFNCEEMHLLILVVVACVLGTLFLGTFTGAMVLYSRSKKTTKSSGEKPMNGNLEFNKPAGIPRIPRANANTDWQPSNLEMTDSASRLALVTKDRPENTAMWDYDYSVDTRNFNSQMPSRTGYGASGATNGFRATKNPYYNDYDDKMRRY